MGLLGELISPSLFGNQVKLGWMDAPKFFNGPKIILARGAPWKSRHEGIRLKKVSSFRVHFLSSNCCLVSIVLGELAFRFGGPR